MNEYYNNYYIRVDDNNSIVDGWSDGPHYNRIPTSEDICINEHGGYQFRLSPDGEENPPLFTYDDIPLYKWDGASVLPRTEEEIAADREAVRQAAEAAERERVANATETVLLEMAADHEERLCMIEMGVSINDL